MLSTRARATGLSPPPISYASQSPAQKSSRRCSALAHFEDVAGSAATPVPGMLKTAAASHGASAGTGDLIAVSPLDSPPAASLDDFERPLRREPFLCVRSDAEHFVAAKVQRHGQRVARRGEVGHEEDVLGDFHSRVLFLLRGFSLPCSVDRAEFDGAVFVKHVLVGLALGRAIRPSEADRLPANLRGPGCVCHWHLLDL